jgi:hypothetical protein
VGTLRSPGDAASKNPYPNSLGLLNGFLGQGQTLRSGFRFVDARDASGRLEQGRRDVAARTEPTLVNGPSATPSVTGGPMLLWWTTSPANARRLLAHWE